MSFDGPGEQDLSSKLGSGATVRVVKAEGQTVRVQVAGRAARLVR